jgi:hypothetical protein
MRESRERQAAKIQNQPIPAKALWRSKQYDHIQSKVKQQLEAVRQKLIFISNKEEIIDHLQNDNNFLCDNLLIEINVG